jgi:hypothetical protein
MTPLYAALYALAVASQVFLISIHLPARFVDAGERELHQIYEQRADRHSFQRYLNRNRVIAVLGLVPALVGALSDVESSLRSILLITGLYFFLQVGGLLIDRDVRLLFAIGPDAPYDEVPGVPPMTYTASRIAPLRFSRVLVVGALVAYVVYVATSVVHQDEAAATLWAKIQIITVANAAFVFLVMRGWVRLRRASTDETRLRRQEVGRSINVLASISIGLSAYFFGKDVLADLGLAEARPLMMSGFLQALALLTVHTQLGRRVGNRGDPGRPGVSA